MADGIAGIEIQLKRKHVNVTTPAKNLLNLDTFPPTSECSITACKSRLWTKTR